MALHSRATEQGKRTPQGWGQKRGTQEGAVGEERRAWGATRLGCGLNMQVWTGEFKVISGVCRHREEAREGKGPECWYPPTLPSVSMQTSVRFMPTALFKMFFTEKSKCWDRLA